MTAWRRHVTGSPTTRLSPQGGDGSTHAQAGADRGRSTTLDCRLLPVEDVPLATLNRKDFEDFAENDGLHLI